MRPEDVALTIRGAFPVHRYRQTNASFIGLDADYSYQLTNSIQLNSKLSLIRAMDVKVDAPLLGIPPGQFELGFEKRFRSGKLLEPFVGLNATFVAEQKNAPRVVTISEIIDAVDVDDLFDEDQSMFDILPPPPAYLLFKLNAGFSLPFSNNRQMDFFLTIDNLFNTRYRNYLNRFRYFADELGTNVSLRINYSF